MQNERVDHSQHHKNQPDSYNDESLSDKERIQFNQELSDLIESFMIDEPEPQSKTSDLIEEKPLSKNHPLDPKPFYLLEQDRKKQERIQSIKKNDPFGQATEKNEID